MTDDNLFLTLLEVARQRGWCVAPCTTCANSDLRGELTRWVLWDAEHFFQTMADMDLLRLAATESWAGALRVTFEQLQYLRDGRSDDFIVAVVSHPPTGGSFIEKATRVHLDAGALAGKLLQYRKGAYALPGRILTTWRKKASASDANVDFVDHLLFYVVRHLPDGPVKRGWVERAADVAIRTGDISLHESLVWTLGARIKEYPELFESCARLSSHRLIKVAMTETGATEVSEVPLG
jgi:hypothetical protein